ncbi:hypothetical protein HN51_005342, partial [Arachis hypogaea]
LLHGRDIMKYSNQVGPDSIREKLLPQLAHLYLETLQKWSTKTSIEVQHSSAN